MNEALHMKPLDIPGIGMERDNMDRVSLFLPSVQGRGGGGRLSMFRVYRNLFATLVYLFEIVDLISA